MIPETFAALLAFVAFIVPGLAFELLRERRRPFIEETAFREACRIALTSMVFSSTAVVILLVIQRINHSIVADPVEWLRQGKTYAQDHLTLIITTVALMIALSLGLAVAIDALFKRRAPGRIVPGSIWFALFRQHRPKDATPWVHLRLSDETEIWGFIGDYTPDQSLENRELVLEGPNLQYRRKGTSVNTPLNRWSFISVRGESITWMKVQYVDNNSSEDEPRIVGAVY